MHEIGIAEAILDAVRAETRQHPGLIARKVAIRVGELAGVDPDALQFSFEALVQGTPLDLVQLEIEICPRLHLCPDCQIEFRVIDFDSRCPRCGQQLTKCVSGDQLEISHLEMESYEPRSA